MFSDLQSRFEHPGLLVWALLFALVPIIIYYLMRFRSLRLDWGASYILERALKRLRRRLNWEQILLLMLRVFAGLALVLAFARPQAREPGGGTGGTHHVLVLDHSYSLLAGDGQTTRWDEGQALLTQLMATWSRGDTWSVLRLGERPAWVLEAAPVGLPADNAALLAKLQPGETALPLAPALDELANRFAGVPCRWVLLSDDQASAWQGMAELAPLTERLGPGLWLQPPLARPDNRAVTSLRLSAERVLLGHAARAFVTVRNVSGAAVDNLEVQILVDGAFHRRESVALLPGQESTLSADLLFTTPGSHFVTARLQNDSLGYDNSHSAGLEVVDHLTVGVLRDPANRAKFSSAWGPLEVLARTQEMKGEEGQAVYTLGPLRFTLVEKDFTPATFGQFQALLLDGALALTPELLASLKAFVQNGGALILAADEAIDRPRWNEDLAQAGLLPATLTRLHLETLAGERYQTLPRSDFEHPGLRAFEGAEAGDWSQSRFFSWHELEPLPEGSVLARFANRQPYAVARFSQPGAVILLAAGLNGASSNLVVREFYPAFLYRLLSLAAGAADYPRTVATGAPISLRLPQDPGIRGFAFSREGSEPQAIAPRPQADGSQLAQLPGGSAESGLYSLLVLREQGASRLWLGVQGPRTDSDLTPLDEATRQALAQRHGLAEVRDATGLQAWLDGQRGSQEWHHWVILALLIAMLGEMALQLRFV